LALLSLRTQRKPHTRSRVLNGAELLGKRIRVCAKISPDLAVEAGVLQYRTADKKHLLLLDEQSHNGRVLVRTRLIAPQRVLLLEFWLFERLGDWLVYDVVVDGISLIQNYRGQMMYVLRMSSYDQLVEKMRQKVCPHGCHEGN
jgi:hypothetical protein